ERMCRKDALRARKFAECFEQMRSADRLARGSSQHGYIRGKIFPDRPMLFHFYKRDRTVERPFYYTLPEGIHRYPHADVRQVVVCGLAVERGHGDDVYEPGKEELLELDAKDTEKYPLEQLFTTKSI